ncbi:MAG: MarR family transcriptional regulator, partial [Phycisphaerae bacterium]
MQDFIERHSTKIKGVISCFDRIVLTGTIPGICYAQGMSAFLTAQNIRIFDFTQWAEPLREEIRANAEKIAHDNGLKIEFIRKKNFRKEDRISDIIKQRGTHPGLIHIYSAMETCTAYEPWHDKNTHKTFLRTVGGKCLHYYFYFINADLGLCYLRVPTWAPFRLQFYFNGHNLLASAFNRKKIDFQMLDNVFVQIEDYDK